jgi:hypothetical protein
MQENTSPIQLKYCLLDELYRSIFENVWSVSELRILSQVSRRAQFEAERLMYHHLAAGDLASVVRLFRRLNSTHSTLREVPISIYTH